MFSKHLFFALLITHINLNAMDCMMTRTLYHESLNFQEKQMLLELLRTSPTILDENNNTVLHMAAAITEWPELTSELLSVRPELKERMNCANKQGITPIDVAIATKAKKPFVRMPSTTFVIPSPQMVQELDASIAHKLALGDSQPIFYSPLEKARILQHLQDMKPSQGNTYLHIAAGTLGYPELTSQLLARNPYLKNSINAINEQGYTALDIAHLQGNSDAVKALELAEANKSNT